MRFIEKDFLPWFKNDIIIFRMSKSNIALYNLEKSIKRTGLVAIMIGYEVMQPSMLSSKLVHFTQLV